MRVKASLSNRIHKTYNNFSLYISGLTATKSWPLRAKDSVNYAGSETEFAAQGRDRAEEGGQRQASKTGTPIESWEPISSTADAFRES